MTVNVRESILKIMGWCPNANALLTKRVLITLPAGEEFLLDQRGNGGTNPVKMGWGNKHRNIVLLMTIMNFAILGFFIWFLPDFAEHLLRGLPDRKWKNPPIKDRNCRDDIDDLAFIKYQFHGFYENGSAI